LDTDGPITFDAFDIEDRLSIKDPKVAGLADITDQLFHEDTDRATLPAAGLKVTKKFPNPLSRNKPTINGIGP
jgi:hypothetical protein